MDKVPMSPQMKSIFISLKSLRFNSNVSQDLDTQSEEEDETDLFSSKLTSYENVYCTSAKKYTSQIKREGKNFQWGKLCLTVGRKQDHEARELITIQSKETVRPQKRSWAVPRRTLVRCNTVDSLPIQRTANCFSSIKCKEISDDCQPWTGNRSNSAPQSPAQSPVIDRKINTSSFNKRIKPKSALVASEILPTIGQGQLIDGVKTRRFGINPSSAGPRRAKSGFHKGGSAWEKLSGERSFLINKWLAYGNRPERLAVLDAKTATSTTTSNVSK